MYFPLDVKEQSINQSINQSMIKMYHHWLKKYRIIDDEKKVILENKSSNINKKTT